MPARRLLAGKVIHSMLTRQVVTKKKFEMWPDSGGKPLRFSLAEFGEVTGLPCGEFEEGYTIDYQLAPKEENYSRGGFGGFCSETKTSAETCREDRETGHFFAFPWGRESFAWTISTMKPGPKVMGKCEDPNGDLCKKLRQKTVKLVGFPLALQLVAFEAIPQLLEQVGGDRCVSVLDFPVKSLPQHSGLTLADVQKADHSPELSSSLTMKPILDSNVEHEERWGVWDKEKYDKKVEYMLRLVSEGHMFSKADWGGDAADPLYVNSVESRKKKELRVGGGGECEPVMKQRRMSEYFKRGAVIDGGKQSNLEKQVEELVKEVVMLKAANVKQGKHLSKLRKAVKKLIGNAMGKKDDDDDAEEDALLVRLREGKGVPPEWVEGGTTCTGEKVFYQGATEQTFFVMEDEVGDGSGSNDDGGEHVEDLDGDELDLDGRDGGEEGNAGEGINGQESVRLDALVGIVLADLGEDLRSPALEEKEVVVDVANKKKEGMEEHSGLYGGQVKDVDKEAGSVEEGENKQFELGASSGGGKEEVVDRVTAAARVDDKLNEQVGASVHDTTEKQNKQIGSNVDEEEKVAEASVTASARVYDNLNEQIGSDVDEEEKVAEGDGVGGRAEVSESEEVSLPAGEEEAVGSGEELTDEEMSVLDVSDSPVTQSERHMPVAQEEELATVLLSRDQYTVSDIVPFYEDCDFPFFEKVLQDNAAVVHLNAGGYNLDNQFFLDLATPSKWVSSTHIEQRHAPTLHHNRAMFMSPWFTAHVQGKARSFKAAKCKARVAGDVKITKYLTRDGQRWGADVDTLLKTMDQVAELMEPLATMLPYIVKKVCPDAAVGEAEVVPFLVDRMVGLYVNERSGDCGPVAVKFMQMLATGNQNPTMAGLTDDLLDMFQK
ncbi:hypothetical protein N665_0405s0009 [Sinapis alba]|nr:hypothetical protein N665_0405s0009 [Sinapis alba]